MLLSCLAGITVADGQCSQSDFVQFNGCMKDSVNALLQGGTSSTDDMKDRIAACFVKYSNFCTLICKLLNKV